MGSGRGELKGWLVGRWERRGRGMVEEELTDADDEGEDGGTGEYVADEVGLAGAD